MIFAVEVFLLNLFLIILYELQVLFSNMCGGTCDLPPDSLSSGGSSGLLGPQTSGVGLAGPQCLIHKPHILTDIILESWKYWSRDCMSVLFSALYSLIKVIHYYSLFLKT